jgi:hypothetical protein
VPVLIDNDHGLGATSYNRMVDVLGLRVRMKPSTFLALARPLERDAYVEKRVQGLIDLMRSGSGIGAPFLELRIPEAWEDGDLSEIPRVAAHEGRHRMLAATAIQGDAPVEVHLFPRQYNAAEITPQWVKLWRAGLVKQGGRESRADFVQGPLF